MVEVKESNMLYGYNSSVVRSAYGAQGMKSGLYEMPKKENKTPVITETKTYPKYENKTNPTLKTVALIAGVAAATYACKGAIGKVLAVLKTGSGKTTKVILDGISKGAGKLAGKL